MSGGSFNYACYKVGDPYEVLIGISDYRDIEAYLRGIGRVEAAAEVQRFIVVCEAAQVQMEALAWKGSRIYQILKAAEWTCSGDTSIGVIDSAYTALKLKEL